MLDAVSSPSDTTACGRATAIGASARPSRVSERPAMRTRGLIALFCFAASTIAAAEDANVARSAAELERRLESMPFRIEAAEKARGLQEDVALKTDVRFADGVD